MKNKKEIINQELIEKNIPFKLIGNVTNRATKTEFQCLKCDSIILATPHNIIINKMGCPKCGKKHRWTYDEVAEFINNIDNGDYKLVSSEDDLTTPTTKKFSTNNYAIIYHKKCNKTFKIRLQHFLNDNIRCSNCKPNIKNSDVKIQNKLDLIYGKNIFKLIPGTYSGRHNEMQVKCLECSNIITDKAFNFLTNHRGCSFCSMPIAEKIVLNAIPNISYQVPFKEVSDSERNLKYDFKYNDIYLECDGPQHFVAKAHFGGEKSFKQQLDNDYSKNLAILESNKTLIRITSEKVTSENIKEVFNSSTTKKTLDALFSSVFYISNGEILLQKGKYLGLSSCTFKQMETSSCEK